MSLQSERTDMHIMKGKGYGDMKMKTKRNRKIKTMWDQGKS